MRFRVWHLLVGMVLVACWLPISQWLLSLEAMDHPEIPQTTAEFVGFYIGSIVLVGIFFAIVWTIVRRLRAGHADSDGVQDSGSPSTSA